MIRALLASALFLALSAAPVAAAPTARFTARNIQGTVCVAPCAVHFDAIGDGTNETTDPAFAREFHSLSFDWAFGDPKGQLWDVSGKDKNAAVGAIAGHVFDDPGTYSVSLRVTNPAGETDSTTRTVTVADPNAHFTDANTYCFANDNSNWSGCPLNCAGGDENCTVTADWRQLATQGDDCVGSHDCADADAGPRRILLRRGDTFSHSTASTNLSNNATPGLIAAFGSGTDPRIDSNGILTLWGGGWTVTGIDIDDASQALHIGNGVDNVTFYRVDVLSFSQSCMEEFVTIGSTDVGELHAFVEVNCTGNGSAGYSAWPGANYVLWMGGIFNKGGGTDSTLRSSHMQHYLIQHTRWLGGAPGREHWQFRAFDNFGAGMSAQAEANRFVLISDNDVVEPAGNGFMSVRVCVDSGCNCGEGHPNCGSDLGVGKIVDVSDFVFERNFFRWSGSSQRFGIFELQGGDFTIRNNVFDLQNAIATGGIRLIVATGEPIQHTSGSSGNDNYHVYNNTVYFNDAVSGDFWFADHRAPSNGTGCDTACFVRNNLLVAPNFTGTLRNHSQFTASQNLWTPTNPFAAPPPPQGQTTVQDFRIASSNPTIVDAGYDFSPTVDVDRWVYDDAYGDCRPGPVGASSPSWDIGADEFGAAACSMSGGTAPLAPFLLP